MPFPEPTSDVVVRAWGPVTVRVAWTLASHGLAVKADILRDARDHVWMSLDSETSVPAAEDRAEALVTAFVHRARRRAWTEPFPEDRDHPLPATWRDPLFRGLSRAASGVLRLHYADGRPLDDVAQRVGEDLLAVEAAREGLREVVRRVARKEGAELEAWTDARLDALIHRLACRTDDRTPALADIVDGLHADQLARCVTANRARLLVRNGALTRDDLVTPRIGAWPTDRTRVLALHVHPDARKHLPNLVKELGAPAFPVAEDLVLFDGADLERKRALLDAATSVGLPERHHLRGVVAEGPGRWTRHGLIGPLVERLPAQVRSVPWGRLDGLGELAERRPDPPSARWAWVGVTGLAAVSALLLQAALGPSPRAADHPLDLVVAPSAQGLWVNLDVDDDAHVVVVADRGAALELLVPDASTARAAHATGDGRYRLEAPARAVLVASSAAPFPDLAPLLATAGPGADGLAKLQGLLAAKIPGVDVRVARKD